jgi:hypothetical protein
MIWVSFCFGVRLVIPREICPAKGLGGPLLQGSKTGGYINVFSLKTRNFWLFFHVGELTPEWGVRMVQKPVGFAVRSGQNHRLELCISGKTPDIFPG